VFFTPASVARRYPRSGIAYRPVSDLPDATLVLAVAAFVRAACAVAPAAHARAEPVMQSATT